MSWDPAQYDKFRAERLLPFHDLAALIRPRAEMKVVDLGCGTGEISGALLERLPGAIVDGIDSSAEMLQSALPRLRAGLRFMPGDVNLFDRFHQYDLIFSNAVLHWIPDHEAFFPRMLEAMKPGTQLAVQMPKNETHAAHLLAAEFIEDPRFSALKAKCPAKPKTLPLERYAELLQQHGVREQVCLEKIYGHSLSHSGEVVEWVKGTLLRPFLSCLDEPGQRLFLDEYRARLLQVIGDRAPYFYPFRRMLLWGVKEG